MSMVGNYLVWENDTKIKKWEERTFLSVHIQILI